MGALLLTTYGFILTGLLGTFITYFWQTRNWRHQQEYMRNNELLKRQVQIVEDLSDLIGQRRFRMFRAIAALRSQNKNRVDDAWQQYDASVVKWNDSINSYITKLRQHFSRRLQYDLDIHITKNFQEIGASIESIKRQYDSGNIDTHYNIKLSRLSIELEDFGGQTNTFIGSLWKHIDLVRNDLDGMPEVKIENIKNLKLLYLLKRVFQPRMQ